MEKAPPADPRCPTCKMAAAFARAVNSQVEFWECEAKHMFVVDRKPPARTPAVAAATEGDPETKIVTSS
jgi:hypothetical protein